MSQLLSILDREEQEYLDSFKYRDDFPGLKEAMSTPKYTVSDLVVTPRDATYWSKKQILPEIIGGTTTRRKYTLKQAIWIKLIQQLRKFDVSLAQIKKIKSHLLMPELKVSELMKSEQMNQILEKLAQNDEEIEAYKKRMNDPKFLKSLEGQNVDIFEIMVLNTIIFRRDVSFIVNVDGFCLPYVFEKHEMMKKNIPEFESIMKNPHIVLSISQAYSQLIQDWSEKKWFNELSIVTKDEKKILALLKDPSTKELKIMKSNNKPDRVILTQDKSINAVEEFSNHIVRNGYQTITIITRQGKPVHFKNEVSIKLNNIPEEPDN